MRKGFQKLAAEMLVEATQPNEDPTIITVDFSGNETKFIVPPERSAEIIQAIDDVGDSQAEKFKAIDPSLIAKSIRINNWLEASFQGSKTKTQLSQSQEIFDNEFLKDPSCVQLFGVYENLELASGKEYTFNKNDHPLILKLADFVPPAPGGRIKETTGPGEFAIGYLFGTPPSRAAGYDFQIGKRQYTVKHQASDAKANIFTYHFSAKEKVDLASNYLETIKLLEKEGPNQLDPPKKPSKAQVAASILGLKNPTKNLGFVSENGETRWALVCNTSDDVFRFKAFSISARLEDLYRQEIASSKGRGDYLSNKVTVTSTTVSINLSEKLSESKSKSSRLISELSRRDQQDVEAIARRVAQEVLEDELGDDFDKAVRREMISSFKDKDVESGIADVSRDFMRKFYRSLGTASSSPLDKVKV